ncbi:MAG TPA: tetratricopeptide repeat protein, partial [bacterium]|nr:tetratricopeptide repeat protein [bacterium]
MSNKFAQAESSFKKISSLSKNNELVRSSVFWLGILAGKQQNYETAVRYLQTVVDDRRSVPPDYLKYALLWLGDAQFKLGRFNEAKLNYGTFSDQFKTDSLIPEIHWRLGFCEHRAGNEKEAIQSFQAFKERFKESRLLLYAHYLLGELFLTTGDYLSSIKELHLILSKWPEHMLAGSSSLTLFWNYRQIGEINGANRVSQRLQRSPRFEDEKTFIQYLNAEMTFGEGKIQDSLPYFFNIVNSRFRERALFQIGRGYFFEDKSREAITNVDILLLEFPNSKYLEECLFLKAESLGKLADYDQALEAYSLIADQNRSGMWRLFALTQTGALYSLRNEHEKAENAFETILHGFPNHPLAYHAAFRLGNIHLQRRNIIGALNYYSMVLTGNILELLGGAYFGLGEVFYQQGKYE